jgi:hypothetical protein
MIQMHEWRDYFDAPYREIKNQLAQKNNLDVLMEPINALWYAPRSKAIAELLIDDLTHWYTMSVVGAIRRLVDSRKDSHSVVRFLYRLKTLKMTDLDGVVIPADEIDGDIKHVQAVTQPAVDLANNFVAHRSRAVAVTMKRRVLQDAVPHPSYGELEAMLNELDAVMVKYGQTLFGSGVAIGINAERLMDASQLRDLVFRAPIPV